MARAAAAEVGGTLAALACAGTLLTVPSALAPRPPTPTPSLFACPSPLRSGYIYKCINDTTPDAAFCPIERVTWRGVNCSDAVGSEHNYYEVADLLRRNATRPRVYNDTLAAPFFNFVDAADQITRQVWFDDPLSLSVKYAAAKAAGWRGVGMWNLDAVAYGSADPLVSADMAAMWAAIAEFRSGANDGGAGASAGAVTDGAAMQDATASGATTASGAAILLPASPAILLSATPQSAVTSAAAGSAASAAPCRDRWLQPFASSSIWNSAIGSAASFVHAQIYTGAFNYSYGCALRVSAANRRVDCKAPGTSGKTPEAECLAAGCCFVSDPRPQCFIPAGGVPDAGVHADQDVLVRAGPDDPLTPFLDRAWRGGGECVEGGPQRGLVPFPEALMVDCEDNNNAFALLLPDNETLLQAQPLYRAAPGRPIMAQYPPTSPYDGFLAASPASASPRPRLHAHSRNELETQPAHAHSGHTCAL